MAGARTVPVRGTRRLLQLVLASLVAVKLAVILLACGRRQGREVARLEVAHTEVWDPEAGTSGPRGQKVTFPRFDPMILCSFLITIR